MIERRASSGFSLVELLVALGVVILLTLLAVPNFSKWVNNQQTRTVAESFANALRLAQSSAVHQSRSVTFCLTNAVPSASLVSTNYSNCVQDGQNWFAQLGMLFSDETVSGAAYYVQGGSFKDVSPNVVIGGPAYINFNSLGRVTSSATGTTNTRSYTFTNYNSDGRVLAVTIDIGGQIRLCDNSRSDQSSTDGCPAILP